MSAKPNGIAQLPILTLSDLSRWSTSAIRERLAVPVESFDFQPRHAEILLDHVRTLLARCTEARSEYYATAITESQISDEVSKDLNELDRTIEVEKTLAQERIDSLTKEYNVRTDEGGEDVGSYGGYLHNLTAAVGERVNEKIITGTTKAAIHDSRAVVRWNLSCATIARQGLISVDAQKAILETYRKTSKTRIENKEALIDKSHKDYLHLSRRKEELIRSMRGNFDILLDRAVVAANGLERYFGIPNNLASTLTREGEDFDPDKPEQAGWLAFDRLKEWHCEVEAMRAQHAANEQQFTYVARLSSSKMWDAYRNASNQGPLEFHIPKEVMDGYTWLRVRSVGAYIVPKGVITYSARLTVSVPAIALLDSSNDPIRQKLPPVVLGNVFHRNAGACEFNGAMTIVNASPKPSNNSAWKVVLEKLDDSILDIEIVILLVGRPKMSSALEASA